MNGGIAGPASAGGFYGVTGRLEAAPSAVGGTGGGGSEAGGGGGAVSPEFRAALGRIEASPGASARLEDIERLLKPENPAETALLRSAAAAMRDRECGRRMVLRALIEFSSACGNDCRYCGLRSGNRNAERYRLDAERVLESARLARKAGIRTIVLQSGEDGRNAEWIASLLRKIKEIDDFAVTLSVGERAREDYALWKEAGADRFLLRVETTDAALYASIHENRTVETRLRCLDDLRELSYQVGSGVMIGFPGQTLAHLARDIAFFGEKDFDMIGIGPFIPHPDTPFRDAPAGSVELTLNAVAVTRLVVKNSWLPATTALGSMDRDYRVDALRAGANVVMPNYTPASEKKKYEIYPGKRCVTEGTGACAGCMEGLAAAAGLELDKTRADSVKMYGLGGKA